MKKLFIFLSVSLCLSITTQAQSDEYKAYLSKYFEVSGSSKTFEVAIKQTVQTMKGQSSGLSDETWNELEKEFLSTSMDDLVDKLLPVYENYLSINDLKAIIKFYESRVGKKLAANTPLITQESMQVGAQWGMELGEKVMRRIEEEQGN